MGINSFNAFILYPVAKAFDPTVGFGMIWRFSCDGWQLITSRLYNACYHRGQRGQHASKVAFWFSRKQLFHGHSDGTIYATIVHWFTPVLPCREKLSVPHMAVVIY